MEYKITIKDEVVEAIKSNSVKYHDLKDLIWDLLNDAIYEYTGFNVNNHELRVRSIYGE